MPATWKYLLIVIFIATFASIVIGTWQLITTPEEILGSGFRGLPADTRFPE